MLAITPFFMRYEFAAMLSKCRIWPRFVCAFVLILMGLAPVSPKAATIYNEVNLDVPVVSESYWSSRWWRYRAPNNALNIDMFDSSRDGLSIWQGRTVTSSYTDINLYVKAYGNTGVSFYDRRRTLLEEGDAHGGNYTYSNTFLALSARIIPERCVGSECRPERTVIDGGYWRGQAYRGEAFSGYLGVSSGANAWWRQNRQHGWLQIDVTDDLNFSVKAYGFETAYNVASVVGSGQPAYAAVPLPAPVFGLLAALGGLILLRRRG